jgi:hypothetical protein
MANISQSYENGTVLSLALHNQVIFQVPYVLHNLAVIPQLSCLFNSIQFGNMDPGHTELELVIMSTIISSFSLFRLSTPTSCSRTNTRPC